MAASGASVPLAGPVPATARGELVALVRLAGPLVGVNLLQMAVYAIDVVFVARLGTEAFAAATLAVFLFSICMWALVSMVGASAPLIAAEIGRRRHAVREVRRSFRMSLWLSVIAATPFVLILLHGETLLRLFGQRAEVAREGGAFLDILAFGLIPGVLAGAMRTAAAALGRPAWTLVVTAAAVVAGALTNWVFIYGHLGAPAMGLRGSALASLVTLSAMFVAYLGIFRFDRRLRRYHLLGRWWRADWPRLKEIARIGAPIALAVTFEGGLFGGASLLMGLIGVEEVAAHAVAINIASVTFQIPFGIAQAATIRVGLAYGARDGGWIARAGAVALGLGAAVMGVTALVILVVPRLLVSIYVDPGVPANAPVIAIALQLLLVAAAFQLFDGAQAVGAGILRGLQDTRVPMLIAAFGYWVVGFGTAILLGFGLRWGAVGIWLGFVAGLLVVTLLLVRRWSRREAFGLLPARDGFQ